MAPRRQVHRRQEALEDEENLEELRAEVARMRKELDRLQDPPFTE